MNDASSRGHRAIAVRKSTLPFAGLLPYFAPTKPDRRLYMPFFGSIVAFWAVTSLSRAEACARIQCWCSFMQTLPCFVEPRTASSTGVVPPTNSNSPHLADSGATWNVRTDKPRFRDPGCAASKASMALNSRSILSSCRRSSDPLATNGYSRPSLPRATNFFGNCFDRKRSTSGSNPTICACDVTSGGPVSASYCPGTSMPIRNVGDRCLRPLTPAPPATGGSNDANHCENCVTRCLGNS